jgi:hypothetical protein
MAPSPDLPELSPVLRRAGVDPKKLQKIPTNLLDAAERVSQLLGGAPYAVIGGLAMTLWAHKEGSEDIDMALAPNELLGPQEGDDIIEVSHLIVWDYKAAIHLLYYRNEAFRAELLATAVPVPELKGVRFARPELLLITQLLSPRPKAEVSAVEIVRAGRAGGHFDLAYAAHWAEQVSRSEALRNTLARAEEPTR